jgi:hypothetical protein
MAKGPYRVYDDAELVLTPAEVAAFFALRLPHVRQRGRYWRVGCPLHGGDDPNFSIDSQTGRWTCFSQCDAGDVFDLEQHLGGGTFPEAKRRVFDIVGRQPVQYGPPSRVVKAAFARATQLAAAALEIKASARRPLVLRTIRLIFLRLDVADHARRVRARGRSVSKWRRIDAKLEHEIGRLEEAVITISNASAPDVLRANAAIRKACVA